jgi:hypothetical protein
VNTRHVPGRSDIERCDWTSTRHMSDSEKNDGQAQCSRVVAAMATCMRLHELEICIARKHCSRMQCLEMRNGLRANADAQYKGLSLHK